MEKSLKEIEAKFTLETMHLETVNENKQDKRQEKKKEKKQENKKSVISDIVFYIGLLLMVGCAVLFSHGAMGEGAAGGYRMYEVLTTSMESVYPKGSLVFIKRTDASELIVGDDITFPRDNTNLVTHRIVEIIEDHEGSGKRAFTTKGVDNAATDRDVVLAEQVLGRVVMGIPRIGAWLAWLGSNLWSLLLVFFMFMAISFVLKVFANRQGELVGAKMSE
jgi:signal peptidase I, archaeal type